jgi:hypothetical protein
MPPQDITGIASSVRPKRRYFIATKIGHASGNGKRPCRFEVKNSKIALASARTATYI